MHIDSIDYTNDELTFTTPFHDSETATPDADDIVRLVGSAVREKVSDADGLYSTVNFLKNPRFNSLQEMTLKFSVGTRVTDSIVQGIVDTATRRIFDSLEGSIAIGSYDEANPQGSTTDAPMMNGIEYIARTNAMGAMAALTSEGALATFLDDAFQFYPDMDCLFVGQEAMRTIYNFSDSPDRLKYGECACGAGANGNGRKRRTVHWQTPYGDLELILSQYFNGDLIVAARKSDLRLMWQAMPELITLPRLNSRYEMLIRCVATLQYMNSTYWRGGLLQITPA